MEEGRKFNTDCPTNKPSSIIHYPLSNKKSGRCSSGFFVCVLNLNLLISFHSTLSTDYKL